MRGFALLQTKIYPNIRDRNLINTFNFMMKKMAIAVITALTAAPAFAGGLLTNTNQSVHFFTKSGTQRIYRN